MPDIEDHGGFRPPIISGGGELRSGDDSAPIRSPYSATGRVSRVAGPSESRPQRGAVARGTPQRAAVARRAAVPTGSGGVAERRESLASPSRGGGKAARLARRRSTGGVSFDGDEEPSQGGG